MKSFGIMRSTKSGPPHQASAASRSQDFVSIYLGSRIFSWQQSYHAMAHACQPKGSLAADLLLFQYQDEKTGRIPGHLTYIGGANTTLQPPFQGFALDYLIRKAGDDFLTPEECARMYPKFAKWTEFWTTYRNAGRGDDVTAIHSPHDSGWDDATIFEDGFPAQNPDLIAFLIVQMEMTARLAEGCGKRRSQALAGAQQTARYPG